MIAIPIIRVDNPILQTVYYMHKRAKYKKKKENHKN